MKIGGVLLLRAAMVAGAMGGLGCATMAVARAVGRFDEQIRVKAWTL